MRKNYQKIGMLTLFLSLSCSMAIAQTKKDIANMRKSTAVSKLQTLSQKFQRASEAEKRQAVKVAKQKGWQIKGYTKDGDLFELMKLSEDGKPVYFITSNANASISTRANTLNSGGLLGLSLNGESMKAYVWDGGHSRLTHQEYDGAGGSNRVSKGDTSSYSPDAHAGHVMGTVLASGYKPEAKGMAPRAKGVSYEWSNDKSEATAAAAAGMILSNHSYGYKSSALPDRYFGQYIGESRDWDEIMYNAPYYLMVVAAGNDGTSDSYNGSPIGGNSAYDKLTGHSVSKNNLVVANYRDANIDSQGNLISAYRVSSSSEGPTDDFRIKPDIAGNGYQVYSSTVNSDSSYQYMTGTSMASPNVMGTLLLVQQHYNNLHGSFMRASTLKGLALHTADDVDMDGPDAVSGWGLMNAKRAAQTISQAHDGQKSIIKELTLNANGDYELEVEADGSEDLQVSISWTDPAGTAKSSTNDQTAVLVNDLDLRVTKGTSTYRPWRLTGVSTNGTGDNDVDPFEKVEVANASGKYTIKVSHEGLLSSGSQNYSLIVTGAKASGDTTDPGDGNPPGGDCQNVVVKINTDKYGSETSWDIKNSEGTVVASGNGYVANTSYDITKCLTDGCYTFTIKDSYGDGMCCTYGEGSYQILINGQEVASGGSFTSSETKEFCIGQTDDTVAPSAPLNLSASGTTATGTNLSWSASTDNVGVVNYKVYLGENSLGTTASTSAAITNLSASTTYTFRVSALDEAGNESEKSNAVTLTTPSDGSVNLTYCDTKGNNSTYEWIDYVGIKEITKTSGNDNGYKDNTDLVANISKGANTINLSAGFSGTAYTENWYVWVDLNQDGTFADSELLYNTSSSSSSMLSGTINIPDTALSGKTRMRVAMKYNKDNSSCGSFSYGEVEDYSVNIGSGVNNYVATGIASPADNVKAGLMVYPNPATSGVVTIKSENITEGTYEIINLEGKLVRFGSFKNGSQEVNVDNLVAGKYIVRVSKNGKTATSNLLIQ